MARKKSEKDVELQEQAKSLKDRAKQIRDDLNSKSKKTIVQMYSDDDDLTISRLSSGSPKLDRILGQGSDGWGWPRGRMCGIHGPESAGKSTVVLHTIAEAQKLGLVVLVDSECVYNPLYAQKLGIDIEELLLINPETMEEAYDSIEMLIKSGDVKLVVIDSLDGLVPKQILEASAEDQFMGVAARINGRFFQKVQKLLMDNDCTLIVVSQIREKIGVMYGSPEVVGGGRALKFYASVRVEVRKDEEIKDGGNPIGHTIKVKVIKNKTASPQQVTTIRLDWGEGLNANYDLIDLAIKDGLITRGGAGWLDYNGRKVQGDANFVKLLETDGNFKAELLEKMGLN